MFHMSNTNGLDPAYPPVMFGVHVRLSTKDATHHVPFGKSLSTPLAF